MARKIRHGLSGFAIIVGILSATSAAEANPWIVRPRGTVVGLSFSVATPTVVYPAPMVVYDPFVPVVASPPVIIVDPWYPAPLPVYYPRRVTGFYIGPPGITFYYQRWR
ncbi:MAG: hypothetical protein RMI91_08100 [Gemmatales bacterium]|nr:hypothetical protein [Gemmatales bacterium]MDW7994603.1 hypothetical protein [Gemmatales bacterium]